MAVKSLQMSHLSLDDCEDILSAERTCMIISLITPSKLIGTYRKSGPATAAMKRQRRWARDRVRPCSQVRFVRAHVPEPNVAGPRCPFGDFCEAVD